MNTRLLIKLLITILLLVVTKGVPRTPAVPATAGPQVVDGGGCIPWTPQTCFPGAKKQVADGGSCIPWTPTTCFPGAKQQLADGGQCTPWTPTTCIPGMRPEAQSDFH